ncbi:MAG: transglutaminase-like domain-containing protein [Planctomycetaceae bacterium]|nr:transglutaminase-like domain-containing protein [Planctomycetaceae bacterium]
MAPDVVSRTLAGPRSLQRQNSASADDKPLITSLRLHIICLVLSLLAAFIFTLTEHDDHEHTLWCVFEIVMQTLLASLATIYFRVRISLLNETGVVTPVLVMVASLSLICEPIQRLLFGTGHAFEMLIMHSQCNLMLALAVCGFRMAFQRLAVMIAVFTTIFCCTISDASGLMPLTLLFVATAVTWLVAAWWETVDRRIVSSETGKIPKTWLATAAALPLLALLAASGFGSNKVTTALKGFMPSSGGTGENDPFSRGGVNDGDALIAGNENIKSFGPLDDAPFVESEQPSLYDVFNDQFDAPPKKIKNQQRAIALPPEMMKHIHQKMAEARKAGREFSLLRSEKRGNRDRIRDLKTKALFYIAGRTPLHLRMEVYDIFDGMEWAPCDAEPVLGLNITKTEDRHWLNIPQDGKGFEVYAGTAAHSVKNANLNGNIVPTPAHPVGVSIDKVDRADMYQVDSTKVVRMNRDSLPSMTPISFVSRCVDRSLIADSHRVTIVRRTTVRTLNDLTVSLPPGEKMEAIRRLAVQWTDHLPRGWPQIAAIESRLREQYALNREVAATSETSPVHEFLFETRTGGEYLFASAAAVMLRSIGYPARLVSGFYARPDRYDTDSRHTPVMAEDAHFWCEVSLGAGMWLTIEPSPGYDILQPPPGLLARLWAVIAAIGQLARDNMALLTLFCLAATIVVLNRRRLQNMLLTLRWRLTLRKSPSTLAIGLARLVDHRLRLAGIRRSGGTTLRRWARQPVLAPVREELARVADLADEVMYQTQRTGQVDTSELDLLARQLSYSELCKLRSRAAANESTHAA